MRLARLVAVLLLCLASPSVLDIIVQASGWLSGAPCCADDCDESGSPCTQQCAHCVGHTATLPSAERVRVALVRWQTPLRRGDESGPRRGHLEPPFRPPMS
jgi:hypothetical protein